MPQFSFQLEITDQGQGTYQAQVQQMPYPWPAPQMPTHTFQLPFSAETLELTLASLSGERPTILTERQKLAREFGQTLYRTVFAGEIKRAFDETYKIAASQNATVSIRLVLDQAGALANLPWEFLHSPQDFLALSTNTPIVRYPKQEVVRFKVKIIAPLRLLVMIANPSDLPPLAVDVERANLEKATRKLRETGQLEIDFLENGTLRDLQRKLREKDYHIFHFIGHSGYNKETGEGWLALPDRLGENTAEQVRGVDLARELSEENTIRLVVLNSCHGAQSSLDNPAGGIASNLVLRGIPAVVAMQYPISNEAASLFAEEFYTTIAEDLPVDQAVSEARRAVSGALRNIEWATPVLYLRANEGGLFESREIPVIQLQELETAMTTPPPPTISRKWWLGGAGLLGLLAVIVFIALGGFRNNPSEITDNNPVDLQIKSMRLSTNRPAPGEFVSIQIVVENLSTAPSPAARLEFLGNDQDGRTLVQPPRLPPIAPGETELIEIPYRYNWFGSFISLALLDPDDELNDPDQRNNIGTLPVVTSTTKPFVINFSNALPNGDVITRERPVEANDFSLWGFVLSTDTTSEPTDCAEAVPWFKLVNDGGTSIVVVGTGLPNNPRQCVDVPLVVTILEQPFTPEAGVSSIGVSFFKGVLDNSLLGFTDRERRELFGTETIPGSNLENTTLDLALGIFDRFNLLAAEIVTTDEELLITELRFGAP
jgi:CHAT domain-containing protein